MKLVHRQAVGGNNRLHSIVTKLMGLEAMPKLSTEKKVKDNNINKKIYTVEKKNIGFISTRSTASKGTAPRLKKTHSIVKPISHLKVPIEPAPWSHPDKIRARQKIKLESREVQMNDMETKLKHVEFEKSIKDLRSLKHILDKIGLSNNQNTPFVPLEGLSDLQGIKMHRKKAPISTKMDKDPTTKGRTKCTTEENEMHTSQFKDISDGCQCHQDALLDINQAQAKQNEKPSDISSEARSQKHHVDKICFRTDTCISLASQIDLEARSPNCSQSSSGRASKSKKKSHNAKEDMLAMDPKIAISKQPRPTSILDDSHYGDDLPSVRISSDSLEDDKIEASLSVTTRCDPLLKSSSLFHHPKKLTNIKHQIQKLSNLSSGVAKPPASDQVAMDHQYVAEILQASEAVNKSSNQFKSDTEKLNRKLVFDVVNELLLRKLELDASSLHVCPKVLVQWMKGTFPSRRQLLKVLCSDIDHLKAESLNEGDDNLMSSEDLLQLMERETDTCKESQAAILEIEMLILKDLIDGVVNKEDT
ncbi:hypothetical protein ZIOFF_034620 [Zingiber officinale]|uniref:DUF4378 domain-containing protein n=1 Tax=Zingiber officinale TaxID=94328 RepID=A0A8J5H3Y2_ZINOF|nr:hypothetical protein ZIOFF_034620 [Zingiber officinale]